MSITSPKNCLTSKLEPFIANSQGNYGKGKVEIFSTWAFLLIKSHELNIRIFSPKIIVSWSKKLFETLFSFAFYRQQDYNICIYKKYVLRVYLLLIKKNTMNN